MPTVAAIVAEMEAQFPTMKVIYASENGIVVGRKPVDTEVFDIPRDYFPMREMPAKEAKK